MARTRYAKWWKPRRFDPKAARVHNPGLEMAQTQAYHEADDYSVKVTRFFTEQPVSSVIRTPDNHLVLFLPLSRIDPGQARCPEFGITDYVQGGSIRFRPAGVTYEWRNLHGHTRVLIHGFSNDRMHQAVERDFGWTDEQLERGLDLAGSRLTPLMLHMLDEVTQPGLGSAAVTDALSTVMIYELCRYLLKERVPVEASGGLSSRQLGLIRDRLEDDPAVALDELAQLCGMGTRNLQRLFKASTGESVSSYARRLQIARARAFLDSTDLPLKEVAFRLGFTHTSSFNAAFRKSTSQTPADYRRRTRKGYTALS
ncbi:helix-turn-helix domain-containing protein [Sphingomonas crocodyli]|uniref:Helix-turn-helix domain-containing protein n=2 Tax=Sphingomonas crocodyli TaxID=1979270 RepID=A0A437MA90_9SPHN|nr:helix-turn-helix domain-containing protein [Sphingomonas crocodyli]